MKVNKLVKKCHKIAVDKGFYDCNNLSCNKGIIGYPVFGEDLERYKCKECNGTGKRNRNVGELLMLIVSELGEALEAHRNNKFAELTNYKAMIKHIEKFVVIESSKDVFETYIKNSFEDEIADTFIRLFDLCGYLEIDIEKYIKLKMEYNKTREYKHGKEY